MKAARDLVRVLARVIRSYRLYEGDHPTLGDLQAQLRKKWDVATTGGPLPLTIAERRVLLEEEVVYQTTSNTEVLPSVLHDHGVVGLVLKRGLEPGEASRFVQVLAEEPDPSVDYASLLWEADLKHVQVLLDSDDLEWEDPPKSPREFAEKLGKMGDDKDAPVGKDYDDERTELGEMLTRRGSIAPQGHPYRQYELSGPERELLGKLLEGDHYRATVRHASRVVHAMAREQLTPLEADVLERAVRSTSAAVASTGDLDGMVEITTRAHAMIESGRGLELRVGELTLDTLRDPAHLWSCLRGIDQREHIEPRTVGELMAQLGPGAAPTVAEWLLETRYPDIVAQAMRVYGETGVEVLVPLYRRAGTGARERIAPALLELGTPEALLALSNAFDQLPDETRLRLLNLIGRNEDPSLRHIVVAALRDPADRVRRTAVGTVRKTDAPAIARLLGDLLASGALEACDTRETRDFFEMLSRIGDGAVARVLAEYVMPKGFRLGRRRLSPLKQLCARSLRRMRSPSAHPVVAELREKGPRAVRDILDDPLT